MGHTRGPNEGYYSPTKPGNSKGNGPGSSNLAIGLCEEGSGDILGRGERGNTKDFLLPLRWNY